MSVLKRLNQLCAEFDPILSVVAGKNFWNDMKWTRIGCHFVAAAALDQTVKPLLILEIEIVPLHSASKIHDEYILKIKKQCSQFRHTTIF